MEPLGRRVSYLAIVAALAVVYFASGKLGLGLAFVHPSATAVWPPAGIALAAMLVLGVRMWPGVLLGAFLVNVTTAGSIATSAGIAVGNVCEALVACFLVNRYCRGVRAFERASDVFRFASLAGLLATTVGPAAGVTSLCLGGFAPWREWPSIALTWWLGDVAGIVIVAPLVILWLTGSRVVWNRRRAVEAFLLLVILGLVGEAVFGPLLPIADRHYPLQFLCFPILVWAAFRFGPRETATAAVVVAGIAIWGTLRGYGTFMRWPPSESLLLLQVFLGVITIMALGLAAAVLEQERAHAAAHAGEANLRVRDRAQSEEALRAGELALAEAQALARVGSWSRDVSGDAVVCSEEFFRICGLPPGRSLTSAAFLSTAHPEDRGRLAEALEGSGTTGEAFAFDHRVRRPDGSDCWVHSRGRVAWDGEGKPLRVFGTTQDVTERRGAEAARSQFIANAAHELRTPLTAIVGLAEIVSGFGRNLAVEQLEDYCQLIRHQGDRVKRLITGLLNLSRMEQGLLHLDLRPVALASVVRRATDAVPLPDGRCLRMEVDDALFVRADASRLEEVLVNLLRNACLYGGPQVTLEASASGDRALLAVSDDGDGVPEELVPHLFEPFMRGKAATQIEGSGLGLAIARGTVEAMGGSLGHEPGQPRGSRFIIRLARSVEGEAR